MNIRGLDNRLENELLGNVTSCTGRRVATLAMLACIGWITASMTAPRPARAASDPIRDCQIATAKALSTCLIKVSKAEVTCFKKTDVGCAIDDAKVTAALDAVSATLSAKCVDDSAVASAGYAPLTPAELGARFEASCAREIESVSTTTFGADGSILAAANDADKKCLLGAGKEAGKLLAKSMKQVGKCAGKDCDLDKIDTTVAKLRGKSIAKLDKTCASLTALVGSDSTAYVDAALAQRTSAAASPCDPIDTSNCLLPFANDYFGVPDPTAPSGRRLAIDMLATPTNNVGNHVDPTSWNETDGFSVGPMLVMDDQQLDLTVTGATPITDIATSLDPSAPVVLIDAETGERQLLWVERDLRGAVPAQRAIIARVGKNLKNAHRYIVAMRNLRDDQGTLLSAGPVFTAYRDRIATTELPIEARRAHMEEVLESLEGYGITRSELYLAWDFTTQSVDSTSRRLLAMRDDAFDNVLGANAPAFTVTQVDEPFDAAIFRRVDGTFQVPLYLTDGGIVGSRLRVDDDGLPTNEGDYFTANFRCLIPYAATTAGAAPAIPARPALYGHGLLGSQSETSASHVRAMASEHNFVICGTAWTGFASEDNTTVGQVLNDFSNFPKFIERQHQGVLNFLVLGRLLQHANGFASDPAFQVGGESVIDPSDLFYDGNSQGGILGGVLAAVAQDITRFSLGVPGMNYSTLLLRSVDFDPFNTLLQVFYANAQNRTVLFAMAQILWDQTDPNGHVNHTLADTYPNTPAKKILYQVAFGDHQVAPVTVEVAARSNGALIYTPTLSPGKVVPEVTPYYGIPAIPSYPYDGSAVVIWDSGNPAPPIGDIPPATITNLDPEWADLSACAQAHGSDPHECPRRQPAARLQKSEFLKTGGAVIDACSTAACLAPLP